MDVNLKFSPAEFSELSDISLEMGCESPQHFFEQLAFYALEIMRTRRECVDGEFRSSTWVN